MFTQWCVREGQYFGGVSAGRCEKNIYMNMRRILNGYRDRVVWIYKHKNSVNGNKENVSASFVWTNHCKD